MLYSGKAMDHFKRPRGVGEAKHTDGVGQVDNPKRDSIMKMYLKAGGDVVTDVKSKTFDYGSTVATSSMATEMIKGKTITEAITLTNIVMAEALDGLPTCKMHYSVLTEEAIEAALTGCYRRQNRETPEVFCLPCEDEKRGCCSRGH